MNIYSAEQTRIIDTRTTTKQQITSYQLMCRAADSMVHWILNNIQPSAPIVILAGPGNNGGDALVCARLLWMQNYNCKVFLTSEKLSPDAALALHDLKTHTHIVPVLIQSETDFPDLYNNNIVLDGIYGSGINRAPEGVVAKLINYVNQKASRIISIDIASGLTDSNNDKLLQDESSTVICPTDTLCIQVPFVSQIITEYYPYTGNLHLIDIRLETSVVPHTVYALIDKYLVKSIYKPRTRTGHKGTFGHALVLAGSKGKSGAAVLSGLAALKSGAGLVTLHSNNDTVKALQYSVPEIMTSEDKNMNAISELPDTEPYSAILMGPGIGTDAATEEVLAEVILTHKPTVLDADALNILSTKPLLVNLLHENIVVTPHPKEFERLIGRKTSGYEQLQAIQDFSKKTGVVVVFKSFYTYVATPAGMVFVNITGNSGMATAGSGDVLAGLIAGLMAQKYPPTEAAILGVALHAAAGDMAAENYSKETLIASDILDNLYKAFNQLN